MGLRLAREDDARVLTNAWVGIPSFRIVSAVTALITLRGRLEKRI